MVVEVLVDLPEEIHARLASLAEEQGRSLSELMLEAIENRIREFEAGRVEEE
jgi:predicted DNA-binding protein